MKQGNRKVYSWIAYVLGTISVFYNYIKHSDQSTGIFLVLIFAGIYLICINVAITSVSINEKKPNFILGLLWVIIPSIFLDWMLLSVMRVTDETIVVVPIIQLIVLIFTIIAKRIFLNSNEYDEVRESAIKNHEKKKAAEEEKVKRDMERQKELDERNAKKEAEKQRKAQEQENKIYEEWLNYHENLISRGMKLYRVSFANHKEYYGGRITPRCYVEAIDKDASIVEARKRAPQIIKHQSITECVVIAGGKNINYNDIANKWKERNHLGYYSMV